MNYLMKELYLMRHSQTLFNQLHRIQGASDSPLTQQGINDAKEVGAYFKQQD
jgi:Fructose-2,6-bisphosphatase